VSGVAMADIIDKREVVKINTISMYKNVADKILKNAEDNNAAIKRRGDVVTQATDITISGSELMDIISKIYNEVISSNYGGNQNIVYIYNKTLKRNGKSVSLHIYVDKKEKLISSLDIEFERQ